MVQVPKKFRGTVARGVHTGKNLTDNAAPLKVEV